MHLPQTVGNAFAKQIDILEFSIIDIVNGKEAHSMKSSKLVLSTFATGRYVQ